jgi:uncharacterized protein YdeI (YjbR/CyaY-like superfamily)
MPPKDQSIPLYHPQTGAEWRNWLAMNHDRSKGVRLVLIKKRAEIPGIMYNEAVEEALCFGWIDSTPGKLDEQRYTLYMSPRKPKSVWSKINKQRIRKLVKARLMTAAGLAKVEAARKDGSWNRLAAIDELVMPADLVEQLSANPEAKRNFEAFSASSKKIILFWIASAKREETRQKWIEETIRLAARNIKAAHYRQ